MMELELEHTFFHCFEPVLDTTVTREETSESIVPDACPDIFQILYTEADLRLGGKSCLEGACTVSGTICASVFYRGEESDLSVFRMEVTVPFECRVEREGLTPECRLIAEPCLVSADARLLNPRKVLLKAETAVRLLASKPSETQFLSGVSDGEDCAIQQKLRQVRCLCTVSAEERELILTDTVHLPGGNAELLHVRAQPVCTESRIIGGKLICKGVLQWQALCRGQGGTEESRFELPFSAVMEVKAAGEDCLITLFPVLTALSCTAGDGNGALTIEATLLMQALVQEERTVQLVCDLYSLGCEVNTEAETLSLQKLEDTRVLPVSLRELAESADPVRRVIGCYASVGPVTSAEEGGQIALSAPVTMTALCVGEADTPFAVSGVFTATVTLDRPAASSVNGACRAAGESYAVPTAGGVEFRLLLSFSAAVVTERKLAVISSAQLSDRPAQSSDAPGPSLVLRPVCRGEQLWDIAKAYRTTVEELVRVNELPDEDAVAGRLLLIPRHR